MAAGKAVSQHCEISQVAKIPRLRNSIGCEIFATLQNSCSAPFLFSLFALLSFWDLICNDEFNSGSSCLN